MMRKNKKREYVYSREEIAKRRIRVSNISYDATSEEIKGKFSSVGKIISLEMLKDENNLFKGVALLTFRRVKSAEKAIELWNLKDFKDRKLVVTKEEIILDPEGIEGRNFSAGSSAFSSMIADSGSTYGLSMDFLASLEIELPLVKSIFTTYFGPRSTELNLKNYFSVAGNVVDVQIFRDKNGNSLGSGVVEYEHPLEAVQAISMLHKKPYKNRRLTVRLYRNGFSYKRLPPGLKSVGMGLGVDGKPVKDFSYYLQLESIYSATSHTTFGQSNSNTFANNLNGVGYYYTENPDDTHCASPVNNIIHSHDENYENTPSSFYEVSSRNRIYGLNHYINHTGTSEVGTFSNSKNQLIQNKLESSESTDDNSFPGKSVNGHDKLNALSLDIKPSLTRKVTAGVGFLMNNMKIKSESVSEESLSNNFSSMSLRSNETGRDTLGAVGTNQKEVSKSCKASSINNSVTLEENQNQSSVGNVQDSENILKGKMFSPSKFDFRSTSRVTGMRPEELSIYDDLESMEKNQRRFTVDLSPEDVEERESDLLFLSESGNQGCLIVIENLPPTYDSQKLEELCWNFGDVLVAELNSSGQGIVRFRSQAHAKIAVQMLNYQRLEGWVLGARTL